MTNSVAKMTFFAHGGISKEIFMMYETLSQKLHPYSILTG
jgi:hypothetical protein